MTRLGHRQHDQRVDAGHKHRNEPKDASGCVAVRGKALQKRRETNLGGCGEEEEEKDREERQRLRKTRGPRVRGLASGGQEGGR